MNYFLLDKKNLNLFVGGCYEDPQLTPSLLEARCFELEELRDFPFPSLHEEYIPIPADILLSDYPPPLVRQELEPEYNYFRVVVLGYFAFLAIFILSVLLFGCIP